MIPQCNPKAGYLARKEEIDAAVARVLTSGWYILGKEVAVFERRFADWLGVQHVVGVANGTDAVELALRAAGIGCGDQVATVSHTAVATVAAIRRCGAIPRFVDIEPDYYTMDPGSLALALERSPEIRAVVVVHLYGQMADMPRIMEIAGGRDLVVIEDCAQAHGASLCGRKAGTWGDAAAFSFYPTKNLGALGDGGAVVTNDDGLGDRLRAMRQYGWDGERESRMDGVNSRLDELQAAVLRVGLAYLDDDNAARRRIAHRYRKGLNGKDRLRLPVVRSESEHVWHQFVVRSANRDELMRRLREAGVGCAVHYPKPVHRMAAYADKAYAPVPLPETERAAREVLSLPMFPFLSDEDVERVIEVLGVVA